MNKATITRSELIESLVEQQPHLAHRDVELAVKTVLDKMSQSFEQRLPEVRVLIKRVIIHGML